MSSVRSRLAWVSGVAVLSALAVGALGAVSAHREDDSIAVEPSTPPPAVVSPRGTDSSPVSWRLPRTGDRAVDAVVPR